jgi:HD-like signal output (HDOD) protein
MYKCYVCNQELPGGIRPFPPIQIIGCDSCINVSHIKWLDNIPTVITMPDYPRLEKYVPEGSILDKILKAVPLALTQLPVLAEIPQRVVKTIHNPDSSIGDVEHIIKEDGVMTTKVLSLSNSAFFATVREIVDLPTACSRLGMRTLNNMANAMAFANQYKSKDKNAVKLMQQLWIHSLATAHCAEALAIKLSIDRDTAYVIGLLHDIGKVVLIDIITTKFAGIPPRLKESPDLIVKAIEPVAHLVGLHVVQYWKLAGELSHPIFFVRHPEISPTDAAKKMSYCLQLASDMAEAKGYGMSAPETFELNEHSSLEALGLAQKDFEIISIELDEILNSFLTVFGDPT